MTTNPQSSGAQPPIAGSMGPQNFGPSMSMQYRPIAPQQPQQFMVASSQQFQPVGQGTGMPAGQNQQLQFSQPMQHLPPMPGQLGHGPPSSQATPMSYVQHNRPVPPTQTQQNNQPFSGVGGMGMSMSSSYTFAPSSYGQPQNNVILPSQYQPISQMHAPVIPPGGQSWLSGSPSMPVNPSFQQSGQQQSVTSATTQDASSQPSTTIQSSSDWQEHTAADGRRYYYNKKTRQSSWEKPLELMTPIERADASTVWKEFTTPEGRKYYYNKVTKQSKWTIPDDLKLAREQAEKMASQGVQPEPGVIAQSPVGVNVSSVEAPSNLSATTSGVASSPVPVIPVVAAAAADPLPVVAFGSQSTPAMPTVMTTTAVVGHPPMVSTIPSHGVVSGEMGVPASLAKTITSVSTTENVTTQDIANSNDGTTVQDLEEAKKSMAVAGKVNVTPVEEKTIDDEPLVYASKQEAKIAFKALLESANVESDWTWEQTMRIIVNDKRYGALRTLGERKQAFNEYLGQRKKLEAEERRIRQKKAREEFTKMLEESDELTSSMRWSKGKALFEDDDRYKAVENDRDREDLYVNYMSELQKKERTKAQEEHKRNITEYKQFLESCSFIMVNSQWRKIQDKLEDDERCTRLEKLDRLEIFQVHIRDLEQKEEEQKKLQKEKLRRTERKNRDEFRKLMEEHIAAGVLTAKTHWRDYCAKVKETPAYTAVALNTSGSKPKDLFEDVFEDIEMQYQEDRSRIKDAMKSGRISMDSSWTLENFKAAIMEEVGSPAISDINLMLVFDEMLERIKEKEDKEAKKRKRLAEDFSDLLYSMKEINASSTWEDSKSLFEDSDEYRSIGDESFGRELFEKYITDKVKEKERKREEEKAKKEKEREEKEKRKEKERKEKEKEKEREKEREKEKEKEKEKEREREREKGKERSKKGESDSEAIDVVDLKEERKREKDKDRKHRKRHHTVADDANSDRDERDDSKKSRKHSSDRKKSKKHAYSPESDTESRHKRHKRDYKDGSNRLPSFTSAYELLEDGELGEDGEIRYAGN